jgi:hypothetical protein
MNLEKLKVKMIYLHRHEPITKGEGRAGEGRGGGHVNLESV